MGSLLSIGASTRSSQRTMVSRLLPCSVSDISLAKYATNDLELIIAPESATFKAMEAAKITLESRYPIVIPTETVYGLAANARDPEAVSRIFTTKGRPSDNPLIVHVSSRKMLQSLLPESYQIPSSYEKLMQAFWPGPLTLLFPTEPSKIPSIVTAGLNTVAMRMPSHPVALAVIEHSGMPLAAPSANSSGRPSPTRAAHVWDDLGATGKVSLILDGGPCEIGVESTVVDGISDCTGALKVLRPGGVTVEDIRATLSANLKEGEDLPRVLVHRKDYDDTALEQQPTTPGMKYLHYTPSVPVILLLPMSKLQEERGEGLAQILDSLILSMAKPDLQGHLTVGCMFSLDSLLRSQLPSTRNFHFIQYDLGVRAEPNIAARRLFDGLLTLEKVGVDVILVEGMEEVHEGLAVMNRLIKAARDVRSVRII